jgi:hypothetical protein
MALCGFPHRTPLVFRSDDIRATFSRPFVFMNDLRATFIETTDAKRRGWHREAHARSLFSDGPLTACFSLSTSDFQASPSAQKPVIILPVTVLKLHGKHGQRAAAHRQGGDNRPV